MSLNKIADNTVKQLVRSVPGLEFTEDQQEQVRRLVTEALESTVDESADVYRQATVMCCGPEADLAHKINEEADRRTTLLISSLSHQR
ncbi:MAG: hypothetical protein ACR2N7_04365 [Acidimicrobiia bacterium]